MELKAVLVRKLVAIVAAFALAFSGVSAIAAPSSSDGGERASASDSPQKKCKKKKTKKKKCKKPKAEEPGTEDPGTEEPPAEEPPAEEPPAEEPTGFVPGRVVELTYSGPTIGSGDVGGANLFSLIESLTFTPGLGETQVMVEVIDSVSPTANVSFSYDSDGDSISDTGFDVCGKTAEPTDVIPGTEYAGFAYLLPSSTCSGVATSGTIIITFNAV